MLTIKRFINSPVSSNCYIISADDKSGCILIDPGSSDATAYVDYLTENELKPQFIILTHQHYDHCASVNELRDKYSNTKLVCSEYCNEGIQSEKKNFSLFIDKFEPFKITAADIAFENDYIFEWNGYEVHCVPTRGHTSGSISIIIDNNIFTGDAWIKDTPTFTKFPTGNRQEQIETEEYLQSFHGMKAWPGHGEAFDIH